MQKKPLYIKVIWKKLEVFATIILQTYYKQRQSWSYCHFPARADSIHPCRRILPV